MQSSRVLFAFLVCFGLCCLTRSKNVPPTKPPPPTTLQELESGLKEDDELGNIFYLSICLAAASSGKNYFQRSEILTDDCVRTAAVTLNAFSTPSTFQKTTMMVLRSMESAFADKSDQMPVEVLCKAIDKASAEEGEYAIEGFEQLKTQVTVPKPAKNYIIQVPAGSNISEIEEKPFVLDDPGVITMFSMLLFILDSHNTAVFKIAENDTLKATGDVVFRQARDHFVEETAKKQLLNTDDSFGDLYKTVDEYYRKDAAIQGEYTRLIEKFEKKIVKNQKKQQKMRSSLWTLTK